MSLDPAIQALEARRSAADLHFYCLGKFEAVIEGREVTSKDWGRDKAVQLLQYLITSRDRRAIHKEQILDRLWEEDVVKGSSDFKIAMHSLIKTLEPNRPKRTESKYIIRQGQSYHLNMEKMWLDSQAVVDYVTIANNTDDKESQIYCLEKVSNLYKGSFLPNRIYEDWSSIERENVQLLALDAIVKLAELYLQSNPSECVRLSQRAIQIDHTWEEAYQLQMKVFLKKGNRTQVIKIYQQCVAILDKEFGLVPLPETKEIYLAAGGK